MVDICTFNEYEIVKPKQSKYLQWVGIYVILYEAFNIYCIMQIMV